MSLDISTEADLMRSFYFPMYTRFGLTSATQFVVFWGLTCLIARLSCISLLGPLISEIRALATVASGAFIFAARPTLLGGFFGPVRKFSLRN
jgi:hypothetical protein